MAGANLYKLAWRIVPKLPGRIVIAGAHLAADITYRINGSSVRQLRTNYSKLTGSTVTERQVREGVRSYFRCYAQQFTLGSWSAEQIRNGVIWPGARRYQQWMDGGPLVLALTHSGNWDLAGAWFCQNWAGIVTVAEKLEPDELFQQFVSLRNKLGLEIIGVGPGDHIFDELVEKTKGRDILVPLLADRDISGAGIEVQLGHSRALVAAGPAALALRLGRPLIAGHISYTFEKGTWRITAHFTDPIPPPEPKPGETDVEALTKAWAAAIGPIMQENVVDWHMMQKVFVDDLDPERLARARAKAQRGDQLQ